MKDILLVNEKEGTDIPCNSRKVPILSQTQNKKDLDIVAYVVWRLSNVGL